jgi:hypothetical protein
MTQHLGLHVNLGRSKCKLDQNGTLVDHFPSQRLKLMVPALIFLPSFRGQAEKDTTELDSQSGNLYVCVIG